MSVVAAGEPPAPQTIEPTGGGMEIPLTPGTEEDIYFGGGRSQFPPGCYRVDMGTPLTGYPDSPTPFYIIGNVFETSTGQMLRMAYINPISGPQITVGTRGLAVYADGRTRSGGIGNYAVSGSARITRVTTIPTPPGNPEGWTCSPAGAYPPVQQPPDAGCASPPSTVDPVDLRDGSWYFKVPCLSLGGAGLPINASVRYSTRAWFDGLGSTSIGRGWTQSYQRRLSYRPAERQALIYYETGDVSVYTQQTDGSFTTTAGWTTLTRNATSGVFTLTYRDGLTETYSSGGALTRIQDRLGNAITQVWTVENGTLGVSTLTNTRTGQALRMEHQQRVEAGQTIWKLVRMTDGPTNGGTPRSVTFGYNAAGQLTTVTTASGAVHTFSYDPQGRVSTYHDPNNNPALLGTAAKATVNTYDPTTAFRVRQQTARDGSVTAFDWRNGLVVTYRPGQTDQRVVRYDHGQFGSITRVYNANSATVSTQLDYTWNNQLARVIDQEGRRTEYLYTLKGDLQELRVYKDATTYDATLMSYNDAGQPLSVQEPSGAVTRWSYTAAGALQGIVREADGTSQTTNVATNAAGQITAVQLPDGTWNTQTYDARGYPNVTTYDANYGGNLNRLALQERTVYDWRGFLVETANRQGVITTAQYNAVGWPTLLVDDAAVGGRAIRTTYSYDAIGNPTQIVNDHGSGKLNATTRYAYQSLGVDGSYVLIQLTDPLNQITRYAYSSYAELTQQIEVGALAGGGDRVTRFDYLPQGWLSKVTLQGGRVAQSITYDGSGRPRQVVDGRGVTHSYSYDGKGRTATVLEGTIGLDGAPAVNAELRSSYDANDRLVKLTQTVEGITTRTLLERSYDGYGRLRSLKDGRGNTTSYEYDPRRDWLLRSIAGANDPAAQVITAYTYDPLGRVTQQVVDPGTGRRNLTTLYRYRTANSADAWHLQEVVEPEAYRANPSNPARTIYRYNALGALESTRDALGRLWSYTYNNLGDLTGTTDGRRWASETYQVDLLGRPTSLTRFGKTQRWRYNRDGTLQSSTDAANQVTTYSYDPTGRLSTLDRVGTNADASFTYLDNDLLASATSKPDGTTDERTTYSYDALNRLWQRSAGGRTVRYDYFADSSLKAIHYWSQGQVSYTRQTNGLISALSPWGAASSSYSYRSTNQLAAISRPSGVRTDLSYDSAGRLAGISAARAGTPLHSLSYGYDASSNVTAQTEQVNGQSWGTTSYTYDALNRLLRVDQPPIPNGPPARSQAYSYDEVGNRLVPGSITGGGARWFADTFEDGNSTGWTTNGGTWGVATSGSQVYQKTDSGSAHALAGDGSWRDYSVQADVRIATEGLSTGGMIKGRVQNDGSYYQLVLLRDASGAKLWQLAKFVNGTFTWLTGGPYSYTAGSTYRLRLDMVGTTITAAISVDGGTSFQYLGTVSDTSFAAGKIGVGGWNTGVVFDNVKVYAAPPDFADTFEDGNSTGWTTNGGTWSVASSGSQVYQKTDSGSAHALAGDGSWRDYSVQADVRIATEGLSTGGMIKGRVQNDGSYYQLVLLRDASGAKLWQLAKFVNGTFTWLNGGAYSYTAGSTYRLRMEFIGSWIYAYVSQDGGTSFQYLGAVSDTSLPTGKIGLGGWNTGVTFDNVRVQAITELRYDGSDRIINSGYSYDANDNLTAMPDDTRYSYDAANRLSRSIKDDVTTDYFYDALGNLIRQKVTAGGVTTTTDFVLDESGPHTRVLGSIANGTATMLYAYGPEGLHAIKRADGSLSYPLLDRLGSVRAATDASGNLIMAQTYDAWGGLRYRSGSHTGVLGYTGEQSNPDGTLHLRARTYQPQLGRFLQRDSFGGFMDRSPSLNRYTYAENNPVRYTDPSGHAVEILLDVASVALSARDLWESIESGCNIWQNAGWLALDVAGAALPFIPAIGMVRHGGDLSRALRQRGPEEYARQVRQVGNRSKQLRIGDVERVADGVAVPLPRSAERLPGGGRRFYLPTTTPAGEAAYIRTQRHALRTRIPMQDGHRASSMEWSGYYDIPDLLNQRRLLPSNMRRTLDRLSHTEPKVLEQARNNPAVDRSSPLEMESMVGAPPCRSCQGMLRDYTAQTGQEVNYTWRDETGAHSWNSRRD